MREGLTLHPRTVQKIDAERRRQDAKFGPNHFTGMQAERVLAVLMEEVGELAQVLLEHEPRGPRVETELTHVAAVAAAWLDQCFASEP